MHDPNWKDDDQLLIDEFRDGNRNAFQHIYHLYKEMLGLHANNLLNNSEEAKDIVADVFVKLWERRNSQKFDTLDDIKSFLFIVTRNACFDHLKRVKRGRASLNQMFYLLRHNDVPIDVVRAEILSKLLAEVENMPESMKRIFLMIFKEGMSTAEVAKELNLAEDTIRVQKSRALKFLKKALGDKGLLLITGFLIIFLNLILSHFKA